MATLGVWSVCPLFVQCDTTLNRYHLIFPDTDVPAHTAIIPLFYYTRLNYAKLRTTERYDELSICHHTTAEVQVLVYKSGLIIRSIYLKHRS